jgi:hypothetical protein
LQNLARNHPQVLKSLWAEATSLWTFLKDVSLIFLVEIAPQVIDFIFEGIAMSNYYHSGDYWWLAFTLVPIFLPGIVVDAEYINGYRYRYFSEKRIQRPDRHQNKKATTTFWCQQLWHGIAFPITSIWE